MNKKINQSINTTTITTTTNNNTADIDNCGNHIVAK